MTEVQTSPFTILSREAESGNTKLVCYVARIQTLEEDGMVCDA